MTARGAMPSICKMRNQNGTNRQMRGSLTTSLGASRYSVRSRPRHSLPRVVVACASHQPLSRCPAAFQRLPADCSSRSWNAQRALDSQYPSRLSASPCISVFGGCAPSRTSRPVTAEVPLRCMPRTSSGLSAQDATSRAGGMASVCPVYWPTARRRMRCSSGPTPHDTTMTSATDGSLDPVHQDEETASIQVLRPLLPDAERLLAYLRRIDGRLGRTRMGVLWDPSSRPGSPTTFWSPTGS